MNLLKPHTPQATGRVAGHHTKLKLWFRCMPLRDDIYKQSFNHQIVWPRTVPGTLKLRVAVALGLIARSSWPLGPLVKVLGHLRDGSWKMPCGLCKRGMTLVGSFHTGLVKESDAWCCCLYGRWDA